MIPTAKQIKVLWDTYHLPDAKRNHCDLVSTVALFFAHALRARHYELNTELLHAAALLHDIDKSIPQMPGQRHPHGAVHILGNAGFEEVAHVVKTHPLHAILDETIAPKTWEEKLLYLADKMVKQRVVGVDGRFALWRAENLPPQAVAELDAAYPKVKELEKEISENCGFAPEDVTNIVAEGILRKS